MRKRLFFFTLVFFMLSSGWLTGQRSTPTELRIDNLYSGEAVQVYDYRQVELEGSLYLSETPMPGALKLRNGKKLAAERILYNLESDALEIITDRGAFAVPAAAVEEFTLQEVRQEDTIYTRFLSPAQFESDSDPGDISFLHYEVEGSPSLLLAYEIEILRPNYIPALDTGSRHPKAVQKQRFFLYDGERLHPIPSRRKRAAELLKPYRSDVNNYLKNNRIDLKKRDDLVRLFHWLARE